MKAAQFRTRFSFAHPIMYTFFNSTCYLKPTEQNRTWISYLSVVMDHPPHTVVQLVQWHFTDNLLLFVVVMLVVGFLAAVSGAQLKLCGWRERKKRESS